MRRIKKYINVFVVLSIVLSFNSCNQSIEIFKNNENFIYFDFPYKIGSDGQPTKERVDSILYSFALEDFDYKTHIVRIPVNTISLAADVDRKYRVEIVAENTTASDSDWDKNSIETCVIRAGKVQDTLNLVIFRTEALSHEEKQITLRLVENENFTLGIPKYLTVQVNFSDILNKPVWWDAPAIRNYLGTTYHREIYAKWIELYYLGADPNTETISYAPNYGKPLWWGNMPYSTSNLSSFKNYYPSTVMFFGLLKKYFDNNVVYPGGDSTKPRILLPTPA